MSNFLFPELESEQQEKESVRKLSARRHAAPEPQKPVHRASPKKCATDRERLLKLLQDVGDEGVSSALLNEHFPQGCYTKRMSELRKSGWLIECEKCGRGNVFYLRGRKDG